MKEPQLHAIAERIRAQLPEMERAIQRAHQALERARTSSDDLYLDSVALNLHSFYGGVERLFTLVAGVIDGSVPTGSTWHQALLQQMAMDLPGVRPPIFSASTIALLDEYRAFRHVVRNVYAFQLDPARLQQLVREAPRMLAQVHAELGAFAGFLDDRSIAS
jgi:hypothetical protein